MSNERPNEFLHWRAQLTKPDALPEQGLDDKELSWQRLAERLHQQPRRPGIRLWIAAACLILVFFLPATLFRNRPAHPNHAALHPPAQRQPVTPNQRQPVTPVQRQPVASVQNKTAISTRQQPAAHPQPQPATPGTNPGSPIRRFNSNYGEIAAISSPAPRHDTIPPILSVAPNVAVAALPNTALRLAATPPAHHPLRIVYLNELGKDPGPSEDQVSRQPMFLRLSTAADWTPAQNNTSTIRIDIFPHSH